MPARDLLGCFCHILKSAPAPSKDSIAVLSAANRDTWSNIRVQLMHSGNEVALQKVDSAIFVICLDNDDSKDVAKYCKNMIHGDGYNRQVLYIY